VTAEQPSAPGLLEGLRVLELGDLGEVAGKLLADAGADVIRVEPPGGARSRHQGPWVQDRPDVNASLRFASRNTSKRGITLDLERDAGAALWGDLVATADLVIDSAGPGALAALGCGFEAFEALDGLVWCSITPFGLTGPWRDWHASDLVSLALGGPMMSTGYSDHDLPPIRADGEHSLAIAGEYATSAILAALWQRRRDGLGQQIDVSIYEAVSATTEGSFANWEYLRAIVGRQTGRHAAAQPTAPWQYQCSDGGWIMLMGGGVPRDRRGMERMVEWLAEHGAAEDLDDEHYRDVIYSDPRANAEARGHIAEVVGRFVQTRPSEEVYRRAQAMHLPWGLVRRPEENLDDPHWEDRGFWWRGELPGFGEVRYPGAPYRFTRSPVRLRRRPPLLGEHNHEVLTGELGRSREDVVALARDGVI
jgi:crotonobetainyl-CoA:carnitine CoA-transferase CaiB-like acyl-CoA transferase